MAAAAAIRSVSRMTRHPSSTTQPAAGLPAPAAYLTAPAMPAVAPANSQAVISVRDLRMRYGHRDALTGLSFDVHRGELFALLGPNSAGKTTTVEILEGYRRRTGGQVSVLGTDPWQAAAGWRARIGVMLQETGPEPDLTVAECLRCTAATTRPWPAGDLLELTGLDGQATSRLPACQAGSGESWTWPWP